MPEWAASRSEDDQRRGLSGAVTAGTVADGLSAEKNCVARHGTKGPPETGPAACRARAARVRPVPSSPSIVARVRCGAIRRICWMSRRMTGLRPQRPWMLGYSSSTADVSESGGRSEGPSSGSETTRGGEGSANAGSPGESAVLDAEVDAIVSLTIPGYVESMSAAPISARH